MTYVSIESEGWSHRSSTCLSHVKKKIVRVCSQFIWIRIITISYRAIEKACSVITYTVLYNLFLCNLLGYETNKLVALTGQGLLTKNLLCFPCFDGHIFSPLPSVQNEILVCIKQEQVCKIGITVCMICLIVFKIMHNHTPVSKT